MRMVLKSLAGVLFTAAGALAASAQVSSLGGSRPAAPFVDISVLGSDVTWAPSHLRYRVIADAGSYVTVFRISPTGRVAVLNPHESALAGFGRPEILRETGTGFEDGQSYLVAVATRSGLHRSALVRRTVNERRWADGRWAGIDLGADASLNELLTVMLPAAGDDFSFAFVPFRVLPFTSSEAFAFIGNCPTSALSLPEGFFSGRFHNSFGDPDRFLFLRDRAFFDTVCRDPRFARSRIHAHTPIASNPPSQPTDTIAPGGDRTKTKLRPPSGPRIEPPVPGSRKGSTGSSGEAGLEPISHGEATPIPNVPDERGGTLMHIVHLHHAEKPVAPPIPVQPETRQPMIQMPAPRPVTPVPVESQRREPISQPPVQPETRQPMIQMPGPRPVAPVPVEREWHAPINQAPVQPQIRQPAIQMQVPRTVAPVPVESQRREPISQPPVTIQRREPVAQPMSTPPPPPPPPPPPSPRKLDHPKVVDQPPIAPR